MQFAGMKNKVTFDLTGDFHRDIRGAKIRLRGNGQEQDPKAAEARWAQRSGQTSGICGQRGRFRLSREASRDKMRINSLATGKFHINPDG
jgi:hypothetical protein